MVGAEMSDSLVIKDVCVAAANGCLRPVDIVIDSGKITGIIDSGSAAVPAAELSVEVINGEGCLALPGLVNAHNHLGMTVLRSYADDLPLWKWLKEKMWPIEDRLTEEDVYLASLAGIAEMIRGGTTTVADAYFHMEGTARAVRESGMRAVLSRGLQGLGGSGARGIREAEELFDRYHSTPRMTIMLAPHSPVTCPPEFMEKIVALAKRLQVPLQIHLAETEEEVETIRRDYGVSPVEYLERTGALECGVIAIHCVHVDEKDIELFRKYNVAIVHCPSSNLKLGSGIAPVQRFLDAGLTVGLGTDSAASNNDLDMWEELRLAALLQKGYREDPTAVPAEMAWQMATKQSARALRLDGVGELRIGAAADVILVDISAPHWYPQSNVVGNLVYAGKAADVRTVIIDGKVVYADNEIKTFDERDVLARLQERAEELGLISR